jgi:hypothetical protein
MKQDEGLKAACRGNGPVEGVELRSTDFEAQGRQPRRLSHMNLNLTASLSAVESCWRRFAELF